VNGVSSGLGAVVNLLIGLGSELQVLRSYNLSASRFFPPLFLCSSVSALSNRFYGGCLPSQTSSLFPQPCMLKVMTVASAGAEAVFGLGRLEAPDNFQVCIRILSPQQVPYTPQKLSLTWLWASVPSRRFQEFKSFPSVFLLSSFSLIFISLPSNVRHTSSLSTVPSFLAVSFAQGRDRRRRQPRSSFRPGYGPGFRAGSVGPPVRQRPSG
jgi:hypothetical protein